MNYEIKPKQLIKVLRDGRISYSYVMTVRDKIVVYIDGDDIKRGTIETRIDWLISGHINFSDDKRLIIEDDIDYTQFLLMVA